ncbi:MAG TPA: hypothetical protein PK760_10475, partial [Flavobacteriales bacterium]|nr:hypothetical protein [Flavobacteriales bacterium]
PCSGALNVEIRLERDVPVALKLMDILGRVFRGARTAGTTHGSRLTIDLEAFPPGPYLVTVFTPRERLSAIAIRE